MTSASTPSGALDLAGAAERLTQTVKRATAEDFTKLEPCSRCRGDWDVWRTLFRRLDERRLPKDATSFEFGYPEDQPTFRVQASSAFARRAWSLSLRGKAESTTAPADATVLPKSPWTADGDFGIESNALGRRQAADARVLRSWYLFSLWEVTSLLAKSLRITGVAHTAPKGLLLVTGRTSAGKSKVARGIVDEILRVEVGRNLTRRPHLVTFEDPIEKYYYRPEGLSVEPTKPDDAWLGKWVDYTPRQMGSDCRSFEEARLAALRQTPTVLYVGEIRDKLQMRGALDFAASGHLVVSTAHSGSLVESVSKVFDAVGARGPAGRAEWASRIFGVVHLERLVGTLEVNGDSYHCGGVVPALYRRTERGLQSLVADGNFSLAPGRTDSDHSLGHAYFAERLATPPRVRVARLACKAAVPPRLKGRERNRWISRHTKAFVARLKAATEGLRTARAEDLTNDVLMLWLALRGASLVSVADAKMKTVLEKALERDICGQ